MLQQQGFQGGGPFSAEFAADQLQRPRIGFGAVDNAQFRFQGFWHPARILPVAIVKGTGFHQLLVHPEQVVLLVAAEQVVDLVAVPLGVQTVDLVKTLPLLFENQAGQVVTAEGVVVLEGDPFAAQVFQAFQAGVLVGVDQGLVTLLAGLPLHHQGHCICFVHQHRGAVRGFRYPVHIAVLDRFDQFIQLGKQAHLGTGNTHVAQLLGNVLCHWA